MARHLETLEEYTIARAGVGRKFQVPSVFRELTVRQNLEVAYCKSPGVWANLMRGAPERRHSRAGRPLRFRRSRRPHGGARRHLSHGQTQWLEIALLMAQNAELILMDEPTAGMTHPGNPQDRGNLQPAEGPAHADRRRARHGLRQGNRRIRFRSCIKASSRGRQRRRHRGQPAGARSLSWFGGLQLMLEINNLSAFYGNSRALQNVTLEVGDAGFLSVLGRNGVGKTTLLRAIVGLMDRTRRQHPARRRGNCGDPDPRSGQARHRLCAAGPGHPAEIHRARKSETWHVRAPRSRRRRRARRQGLRPVSRC